MNNKFFENLYKNFLNEEQYKKISKHFGLIRLASKYKIALAGSMGLHIGHKNPKKLPNDIDFVTDDNEKALNFIIELMKKIDKYIYYGRINIQNKTNRCYKGTVAHYKIITSFGIDICVMVLKDKLNYWFNKVGYCIQKYDDIIKYSKQSEKIDNKKRPELIIDNYEDSELIDDNNDYIGNNCKSISKSE